MNIIWVIYPHACRRINLMFSLCLNSQECYTQIYNSRIATNSKETYLPTSLFIWNYRIICCSRKEIITYMSKIFMREKIKLKKL